MIYETDNETGISYSRDQDGISKALPQLCFVARTSGMECNVLQRKALTFIALLCLGGEFHAYWLPFDAEYDTYRLMSLLIDERHETSKAGQIMDESARWQIRATHPDWPCVLSETAWEFYDFAFTIANP